MKIYLRIIFFLILIVVSIDKLKAQVNLDMASEFNISVESYGIVKVSGNWLCYETYLGLRIIALDEVGNYGEEFLLREKDIFDFAISDSYLVVSRYDYNAHANTTIVSLYDLSIEGFPLVHEEFNQNYYQVCVDIVGDYFFTGSRVYPSGFITKVYSLNSFELVGSYEGLRSYECVGEDKIMIGNSAEPITYEIYKVTNTGELELSYSFNQFFEKAIIDNNSLALKNSDKIDFYTIGVGDSLIFEGSYTLPFSDPLTNGFYYQNGVIAYNRYIWGEFCNLDLVDVSDLDNPILLESFDYLTMTNPDEIESVFACVITSKGNNIYPSLANKPLIHLRVEQNSSVSFIEMVEGYTSGSYWSNIREDKIFLQDSIYLQTTDVSDPYNPTTLPNDYPTGRYRWFDTADGVYCTRNYPNLDYLYLYKLGEDDSLILQDSVSVHNSDFVYAIYFDGNELIYFDESYINSISITQEGQISNWSIPDLQVLTYAVFANNYLYISHYSNYISIYHIDNNNPVFITNKYLGYHYNISLDETNKYLTVFRLNDVGLVYDIAQDPSDLSINVDMGILAIDSNLTCLDDYMMFVGQSNNDNASNMRDRFICIFKETDQEPLYIGCIPLNYSYTSIKCIMNEESQQMMIVLYGNNGTVIYTGTITPNGDLEITPASFQAVNYPNPFNPQTTISYNLSRKGKVNVDIYNLKGQKVKSLLAESQDAGTHSIVWKGDNDAGKSVSSGTYFYRVKNGNDEIVKKMLLMK